MALGALCADGFGMEGTEGWVVSVCGSIGSVYTPLRMLMMIYHHFSTSTRR